MKTISDMSKKERKALISYELESGSTVYYSKLTIIDKAKKSLFYDGNTYDDVPSDVLDDIYDGKQRYELYMLTSSQANIESIIQSNIDTLISTQLANTLRDTEQAVIDSGTKYSTRLDNYATSLSDKLQPSVAKINSAATSINDSLREVSSIAIDIRNLKATIKSTVDDLSFTSIQSKLNAKLDELQPVKAEFQSVVDSLKSLFKD